MGIGRVREVPLAWRIGVGFDTWQISFKGYPTKILFVSSVVEEQRTGEDHRLRVSQRIQNRICETSWPSVLAVGNTVEIDVRVDAASDRSTKPSLGW
jgi:hypothetical protein